MKTIRTEGVAPTSLEHLTRENWEVLVGSFRDSNQEQDWSYAEVMAKRRRAKHEEVGIWKDKELMGIASIRLHTIPMLGWGIAYISGGPLVNRGDVGAVDRFRICIQELTSEYVQNRGMVLRVICPIGDQDWNRQAEATLVDAGMVPCTTGRGYRTLILDVSRSTNEIRKTLSQKWRNGLNRAERQALQVRWSFDDADFEQFALRHAAYVQSKRISLDLDASFYAEVKRLRSERGGLAIAWAEYGGEVVAGHLGSYRGDTAVYLLGFSDDRGRQLNAAYFLQWAVIERAHDLGMKWYDLGGIDPASNPGVYHFKLGMRGDDVRAAGPFEIAPGMIRKYAFRCFEYSIRLFNRLNR